MSNDDKVFANLIMDLDKLAKEWADGPGQEILKLAIKLQPGAAKLALVSAFLDGAYRGIVTYIERKGKADDKPN